MSRHVMPISLAQAQAEPCARPVEHTWHFVLGLPQSIGSGSAAPPSFSRNDRGAERGPVPIELIGICQPFQQTAMQARPDAGRLSVAWPSPARHARAANLNCHHLPGMPTRRTKRMSGSGARSVTSGIDGLWRQEWLNHRPRALDIRDLAMPSQRTHPLDIATRVFLCLRNSVSR
jgi:hypothetical protein